MEFHREKADDFDDHASKLRNPSQDMDQGDIKDPLLKGKPRYLHRTGSDVLKSFKWHRQRYAKVTTCCKSIEGEIRSLLLVLPCLWHKVI